MNARLLTLVASTFVFVGCEHGTPQQPNLVKVERVDKDTKLKETYTAYTDSKGREVKHGSCVIWWDNGAKYVEANYDHGELDGKCSVFSENGKVQIEGWYRHGKPWDGEFHFGHEIRKYDAGKLVSSRTDEK